MQPSRSTISFSPRLVFVGVIVPAVFVAIDHWLLSIVATSQSIAFTALLFGVFVVQVGVVGVLCGRLIESPLLRTIIFGWSWALIDLQTLVAMEQASPMSFYYGLNSAMLLTKSLFAAQLGLVTIWAVLGTTWWVFRWPASLMLAALLTVPLSNRGLYWDNHSSIFIVQTLVLAAICGVLRWQRYRVATSGLAEDCSTSEPAGLRGTQFGLRHVLTWMTSLAVVLGIARAFDLLSPERFQFMGGNWIWIVSAGVVVAIMLIVALWAALGSGPAWLRWALLIAAALLSGMPLALADYYNLTRQGYFVRWKASDLIQYEWWVVAWVCLAGGLLFSSLLIYRTLGYRLSRSEITSPKRKREGM